VYQRSSEHNQELIWHHSLLHKAKEASLAKAQKIENQEEELKEHEDELHENEIELTNKDNKIANLLAQIHQL
jgi:hypothetical protein